MIKKFMNIFYQLYRAFPQLEVATVFSWGMHSIIVLLTYYKVGIEPAACEKIEVCNPAVLFQIVQVPPPE